MEIKKLKLSELTCRQGVIEVVKIIYGIHDVAKDRAFELVSISNTNTDNDTF